jgi:uncharacterized protein HemX
MIETALYLLTALAVVLGLGVAVWTYVDTRQKYYNEYIERHRK